MARQGMAFATAQEARVVYPLKDGDTDADLVDVPRDGKTVGEIVTRGNIVMKEVGLSFAKISITLELRIQYFRDPQATRKAFRGGYFSSGDLAVMDPDGAVKIIDRSKDIIISGGEVASRLSFDIIILTTKYLECVECCH